MKNSIKIKVEEIIKIPAKETLNENYLIQLFGFDVYVNKRGKLLSVHKLNKTIGYLIGVIEIDTFFDELPSKKQIKRLASETIYYENSCYYNSIWDYEQYISDGKQELQVEIITDTYYVDGTSRYVYSNHKVDKDYFNKNYRHFNISKVYNAPKNEKKDGVEFFTSKIPLA